MDIRLNDLEIQTGAAEFEKLVYLPKDVYQHIKEEIQSEAFTIRDKGLVRVPVKTRIGEVYVAYEVVSGKRVH